VKGFQVEAASRGQDGLTMQTAVNPDLIILDIMLPDIDGFESLPSNQSKE